MDRRDVGELFYIVPLPNVPSIIAIGLLSDVGAAAVAHKSVADPTIKARRATRTVSASHRLPDFVNLYFCARNKMMFKIHANNPSLDHMCVLRLSHRLLDIEDAVIADGNASSDYTRFDSVAVGLPRLDADRIHAEYWTHHPDEVDRWEHGRVKAAELLVLDVVDPEFILGGLVATATATAALRPMIAPRPVVVAPYVFFRGPKT